MEVPVAKQRKLKSARRKSRKGGSSRKAVREREEMVRRDEDMPGGMSS
jgi:hypothetical protein